eukprot:scaffold1943_cov343-Pavlova_lutheri.AAC.13
MGSALSDGGFAFVLVVPRFVLPLGMGSSPPARLPGRDGGALWRSGDSLADVFRVAVYARLVGPRLSRPRLRLPSLTRARFPSCPIRPKARTTRVDPFPIGWTSPFPTRSRGRPKGPGRPRGRVGPFPFDPWEKKLPWRRGGRPRSFFPFDGSRSPPPVPNRIGPGSSGSIETLERDGIRGGREQAVQGDGMEGFPRVETFQMDVDARAGVDGGWIRAQAVPHGRKRKQGAPRSLGDARRTDRDGRHQAGGANHDPQETRTAQGKRGQDVAPRGSRLHRGHLERRRRAP